MQRRLIEKYGERVSVNGEEYWLSPTPERFVEAGVRGAEGVQALGEEV